VSESSAEPLPPALAPAAGLDLAASTAAFMRRWRAVARAVADQPHLHNSADHQRAQEAPPRLTLSRERGKGGSEAWEVDDEAPWPLRLGKRRLRRRRHSVGDFRLSSLWAETLWAETLGVGEPLNVSDVSKSLPLAEPSTRAFTLSRASREDRAAWFERRVGPTRTGQATAFEGGGVDRGSLSASDAVRASERSSGGGVDDGPSPPRTWGRRWLGIKTSAGRLLEQSRERARAAAAEAQGGFSNGSGRGGSPPRPRESRAGQPASGDRASGASTAGRPTGLGSWRRVSERRDSDSESSCSEPDEGVGDGLRSEVSGREAPLSLSVRIVRQLTHVSYPSVRIVRQLTHVSFPSVRIVRQLTHVSFLRSCPLSCRSIPPDSSLRWDRLLLSTVPHPLLCSSSSIRARRWWCIPR
jgi:hypothetical protein